MVINNRFVDSWTLVHLATGGVMGLACIPRWLAYALIFGGEVIELVFREPIDDLWKDREGLVNIVGDVFFTAVSYELVKMLACRKR